MFGKLSVRNIPQQIFTALEVLADEHDRSTEAEARQAIRAWTAPSILALERNARRAEVAERLGRLLDQVNAAASGQRLRPSHIAQSIGQEKAADVEDWFLGKQEPTFVQLEAIAAHLGCVIEWLQHGDGCMFPMTQHRLSDNAFEAANWLTTWEEGEPVKTVHLIREQSKNGELLIVQESDKGQCRTYTTQYHVSDVIGAGGESALAHLLVTLELLYRHHFKLTQIDSYLLKSDDADMLRRGNTHPLALLKDKPRSTWWEDIWDAKMSTKHEYWPGWKTLCESIGRAVESRKTLVATREKIRRGEYTDIAAP